MRRFRQSNDFYYLTGLEVPGAYLLLDARQRRVHDLPRRTATRSANAATGRCSAAEDAAEVADAHRRHPRGGNERLAADLARAAVPRAAPVYLPLAPEEGPGVTRDSALAAAAWAAADPFDDTPGSGRGARRRAAAALRAARRSATSRRCSTGCACASQSTSSSCCARAARLCGLAVIEAMRSTAPGVLEHELEAIADFVFRQGGARGPGYEAIIAGGTNAWYGHYNANDAALGDGDLVLMDYAPDYRLLHERHRSDVAGQRPLLRLAARALRLRARLPRTSCSRASGPGGRPRRSWTTPPRRCARGSTRRTSRSRTTAAAAEDSLVFRGHLSHPVGMSVHDVGDYRGRPLEPGLVFAVDPMIWVHRRSASTSASRTPSSSPQDGDREPDRVRAARTSTTSSA